MKKLFFPYLFLLICFSCQEKKVVDLHNLENDDLVIGLQVDGLVGQQATLHYPTFKVAIDFISLDSISWHYIDSNEDDQDSLEINFQDDVVNIRLSENLIFISYVEDEGKSVSQVYDLKERKVFSYFSYFDQHSEKMNRSGKIFEGEVEFSTPEDS